MWIALRLFVIYCTIIELFEGWFCQLNHFKRKEVAFCNCVRTQLQKRGFFCKK